MMSSVLLTMRSSTSCATNLSANTRSTRIGEQGARTQQDDSPAFGSGTRRREWVCKFDGSTGRIHFVCICVVHGLGFSILSFALRSISHTPLATTSLVILDADLHPFYEWSRPLARASSVDALHFDECPSVENNELVPPVGVPGRAIELSCILNGGRLLRECWKETTTKTNVQHGFDRRPPTSPPTLLAYHSRAWESLVTFAELSSSPAQHSLDRKAPCNTRFRTTNNGPYIFTAQRRGQSSNGRRFVLFISTITRRRFTHPFQLLRRSAAPNFVTTPFFGSPNLDLSPPQLYRRLAVGLWIFDRNHSIGLTIEFRITAWIREARPELQETKIILVIPIVRRRPHEDDSWERDEKECEERQGWMRGGRAGMASSETGIAKVYFDNDEEASLDSWDVVRERFPQITNTVPYSSSARLPSRTTILWIAASFIRHTSNTKFPIKPTYANTYLSATHLSATHLSAMYRVALANTCFANYTSYPNQSSSRDLIRVRLHPPSHPSSSRRTTPRSAHRLPRFSADVPATAE
ncbi:uncharacterized protein LACBIDRAFT_331138 [Laccaria bicolor S238N-H82]|uniref:Predicted protein n=1 Tax=Laccaria bicolor (strain S238N-H82 / ATCC MYA-4686) TaxID=486041 RepID=B0DNK9_LACBS|nr:uncharacterized protein LACBIDRAFT_331138 [Laccaria bicolor S238N-H82]EDR03884.1 predicted protein [Laccaria bicolor S238N-H82]|eukprot:XP_001885452.1 predicted protein [Laccaria bicolor S238N-H82]